MIDLLTEQLKAHREYKAFALVTLVKTQGATPRSVGSKMMVFSDGSTRGTIGGGVLEKQVVADALLCLRDRSKALKEYENRAEEADSPCGGTITVYMEADETAPHLVVCGAGHVGGALIKLASMLKYHVTAIDTRNTEMIAENVKQADNFIHVENFHEGIEALDFAPGAYYLVSTYGHTQDGEALAAVLKKEPAYIGMMGSPVKIQTIFNDLRKKGFEEEQLTFIHTPVGLNIGGEDPPEIALSILSEIQMIRYHGNAQSMRDISL